MTAWSPWEADDAEGLIKESATAKITFKGSNWAGVSDQGKQFH